MDSKNAGISLLLAMALIIFTMVLHPAGGSVEYLQKISRRIVLTHSIAIMALPFAALGFWGLTQLLGVNRFLPIAAFAFIMMGLIAVMIAAVTNGLILPIFIQRYYDAAPGTIESFRLILKYIASMNAAFDYVFAGASSVSILLWSVFILIKKTLPVITGYFGILLFLFIGYMMISEPGLTNLLGFRIFTFGVSLWFILVGIQLMKAGNSLHD